MASIVIVDDNLFIRNLIRGALEKGGHTIIAQFSSGQELLDQFSTLKPDLITLDLVMDEMTGMETLERLIGIDPKVKVIMISAIGKKETITQALKLGARDFVRKPFQEKQLLAAVEKIIPV